MDEIDIRFFLAFVAPTLGFAVWFGKRWMEDRREQRRLKSAQDNLVRALYAEIDLNVRDLTTFLDESPSMTVLRQAIMSQPGLIPHITNAPHSDIYRESIGNVASVSDGTLHQTLEFYAFLEKINTQIEGLSQTSFLTLSSEGRVSCIGQILVTAERARARGVKLLRLLESDYSWLLLHRFDDVPIYEDAEELKVRLDKLGKKISGLREGQAQRYGL